jgi:crossover junction endodeoxyribonuclease RuvC
MMRIIGIDPGLEHTGWGIIDYHAGRLSFVAAGVIDTKAVDGAPQRLAQIDTALNDIILEHKPLHASVEETFVNTNSASSLKLSQARGVALCVPARLGLMVCEYATNTIKKTVVGKGHADKTQIQHMVRVLLPLAGELKPDAADALAAAICHAHHAKP